MPSSASNTRLWRVMTSSRTSFSAFRPARSRLFAPPLASFTGATGSAVLRVDRPLLGLPTGVSDLLAIARLSLQHRERTGRRGGRGARLCAAGGAGALGGRLLGGGLAGGLLGRRRQLDFAGHAGGDALGALRHEVRDLQREVGSGQGQAVDGLDDGRQDVLDAGAGVRQALDADGGTAGQLVDRGIGTVGTEVHAAR